MRRALWAPWMAVLLAGCPGVPDDKSDCEEFDHRTIHAGAPVVCRMLWCMNGLARDRGSGIATLWCDPSKTAPAP